MTLTLQEHRSALWLRFVAASFRRSPHPLTSRRGDNLYTVKTATAVPRVARCYPVLNQQGRSLDFSELRKNDDVVHNFGEFRNLEVLSAKSPLSVWVHTNYLVEKRLRLHRTNERVQIRAVAQRCNASVQGVYLPSLVISDSRSSSRSRPEPVHGLSVQ